MANDVFANGREISCKKADGKSICAFPDVCMTPPENPATPPGVPVPYPNTGFAKDTTSGSKSVRISDQEVILKNKSYFKKSTGDEAGSATKKGVITSVNRGKVYFNAWSMDVKFEGENIVRHLDLTTHNHASMPGDTPVWPYIDTSAIGDSHVCKQDHEKERAACEKLEVRKPGKTTTRANRRTGVIETVSTGGGLNKSKTMEAQCADTDEAKECQRARKCMLTPYERSGSPNCCPDSQAHHLVEVHGFGFKRDSSSGLVKPFADSPILGKTGYDDMKAPCVCATGAKNGDGEHFDMHAVQGALEIGAMKNAPAGKKRLAWNYSESRDAGITAHKAVFPDSNCNPDCLKAQLDNYHKQESMRIDDDTPLHTRDPGLKADANQHARGLQLLTQLATGMKKAAGLILPS